MGDFYFRPSGEETLRLVLPLDARLYTVAAFGVRPGKSLVVVDRPVQVSLLTLLGSSSLY